MRLMDCTRVAADEIADQYILGRLTEEDREAYESHFFVCERCFDELKTVESMRAELQRATPVTPPEAPKLRHDPWRWAAAAAAAVAIALVMWGSARLLAPADDGSRTTVTSGVPQSPATENRGAGVAARLAELSKVEPPPYLPLTMRSEEDARIRFEAAMTAYARSDYAGAATALEQVVSLQPSNAKALFFLGICYLMLDRPASATKVLQQCVAGGDPGYSDEARYFLAKALLRTGDRAAATAALDALARSKGPRAEDARRLRDALAGIPDC